MRKGLILLLLIVLLAGCLPGSGRYTEERPSGLLWGIWHGWVSPISLIVGIFRPSIRVYETVNTGWWYDFGFYMAIVGGFGGLSLSRRRKRRVRDQSED